MGAGAGEDARTTAGLETGGTVFATGGTEVETGGMRHLDGRRMTVAHLALLEIVLEQVTAVVHGLGGLDLEADAVRQLVDFAEDLLEFLAGEQVDELAAAHGNQEEDIPHDDGQLFKEVAEAVEILGVVAADGGVDLDGKARFTGPLDGLDGARICAGQTAKSVVNLRVEPSREMPRRTRPASLSLKIASRVSSGVALGVRATWTPLAAA